MRPTQLVSVYLNEGEASGSASSGEIVQPIVNRDSFFSLANGTLTVDINTTGQTVTTATIYVNTISVTVGANTVSHIFANFDFILSGVPGAVLGDIRFSTVVGTGFPDTIDSVPTINFGFGQLSTTGNIFPTIFSLAPDQMTLQVYAVTSGNNQRGQVQRSLYY